MNLLYREATEEDLPQLLAMLGDGGLGSKREDTSTPLNPKYISSFRTIDSDPNNTLVVVLSDNEIVGMLQLTFIPYLTYIGSWRCMIEGVRIHSQHRGKGLGKQLLRWAIHQAQERNCRLVQLTSNKAREGAIRFYKSLGFVASHEGFKLHLE